MRKRRRRREEVEKGGEAVGEQEQRGEGEKQKGKKRNSKLYGLHFQVRTKQRNQNSQTVIIGGKKCLRQSQEETPEAVPHFSH